MSNERKTPWISILAIGIVVAAAVGAAVTYADYSGSGNNSTNNKMVIIEKIIDNKTNDSKPNIIYSNSSTVNNNITTTIINNGVASNVSVVAVADKFGNEGVSVQLSDTAIVKAGTAAPVAKLQTIKTKLTRESEVDEEETGLEITDMFLGDSKRPCEFVNITNNGEFPAHLEGMRLEELEDGNVFTFSDVSIKPGKTLQVYSSDKAAKDTKYYLGLPKSITQSGGIWDDYEDTAFLVCGYDDSVISKYSK